jgi:hypothetical protein
MANGRRNNKRSKGKRGGGGGSSIWQGTFTNTILGTIQGESSGPPDALLLNTVELIGNAPTDRAYQLRNIRIRAIPISLGATTTVARPFSQILIAGSIWTTSAGLPLNSWTLLSTVNPTSVINLNATALRAIAPTILNPVRTNTSSSDALIKVKLGPDDISSDMNIQFEITTVWAMGRQETLEKRL